MIDPRNDESMTDYSRQYGNKANQSSSVGLYHELIHSWRHLKNPFGMRIIRINIPSKKWDNLEEKKVISIESKATKIMPTEAVRPNYYDVEKAIRKK